MKISIMKEPKFSRQLLFEFSNWHFRIGYRTNIQKFINTWSYKHGVFCIHLFFIVIELVRRNHEFEKYLRDKYIFAQLRKNLEPF